jgi:hypothetical protein
MGRNRPVKWRREQPAPVDAATMHEWEADTASRVAAGLLFWCWYLPADALRLTARVRALIAVLARGLVLLRYPLYTAPVRAAAAKVPARK